MPSVYMLVGVPGSGKSTWTENQLSNGYLSRLDHVVISTDALIENYAHAMKKTYNEVFREQIMGAQKQAEDMAKEAFAYEKDVIWDQTNVTKKSRARKLRLVPKGYRKVAVYFVTPEDDEWTRRLENRTKRIPAEILIRMVHSLEAPDTTEGFDLVLTVAPNGNITKKP